jgi:hypothetical protein
VPVIQSPSDRRAAFSRLPDEMSVDFRISCWDVSPSVPGVSGNVDFKVSLAAYIGVR